MTAIPAAEWQRLGPRSCEDCEQPLDASASYGTRLCRACAKARKQASTAQSLRACLSRRRR